MTPVNNSIATKAADNIRILSAAMVEKANSGHPGGPMGGADFIHILFAEFMNFDPTDTAYPFRDRFFLDPGHLSAMLYSQLSFLGFYNMEELANFRQWGSPTPGHPEIDIARGIENTSGPLGQGHAFGIGAAIAERFLVTRFGEWMAHKTYIYISDGGIQEEIAQGAGRIAGFLGLGNVIMFYDANDVQLSSMVDEVMDEDTAKKYEAWGWHVITIEGNNPDEIRQALQASIDETERPSLIIGKTIMGKGAVMEDGSSYEGQVETHGKPLGSSKASYEKTIENLGGDINNPFRIFPEVADYYQQVLRHKKASIDTHRQQYQSWKASNPELAAKLDQFLTGTIPDIDFAQIDAKQGKATRDASGSVMAYLADHVENVIVSSADLSDSDRTKKFLDKTTSFKKGDFTGSFLQAGVSELTMAALCTGMSLHGGVIPICATFFVFSDFMKPTIRLAALMQQPVIFVWTHDAFRVGEDGPTHQPIEQEAQIRLMEKLKNHHGQNSFLALRPADGNETVVSWEMALKNRETPSGLILSRQGIPALPGSSYEQAQQVKKGGYIVTGDPASSDIILVANGSEVSTLVGAAALLEERKQLKVAIVSVPSEGVFSNQDQTYRTTVLPKDKPKFGLTAGLPINLEGLVGDQGQVFGMTHFGYSAPYKVLDEQFGFSAEKVYNAILNYLGK